MLLLGEYLGISTMRSVKVGRAHTLGALLCTDLDWYLDDSIPTSKFVYQNNAARGVNWGARYFEELVTEILPMPTLPRTYKLPKAGNSRLGMARWISILALGLVYSQSIFLRARPRFRYHSMLSSIHIHVYTKL